MKRKTSQKILVALDGSQYSHRAFQYACELALNTGPDEPMSGKFFNTDTIKPRGFVEYAAENLVPGNYSFYSATDPKIKGQLQVIP